MSAFLVTNETINALVWALQNASGRSTEHDTATLAGQIYGPEATSLARLGQVLVDMNAAAVRARYGDCPGRYCYRYRPTAGYPLVAAYKATRCYLYQCSEGTIPDLPEFQDVQRLADRLAHQIAASTEAYQNAEWDLKPVTGSAQTRIV